jgi:hypothetical protein
MLELRIATWQRIVKVREGFVMGVCCGRLTGSDVEIAMLKLGKWRSRLAELVTLLLSAL